MESASAAFIKEGDVVFRFWSPPVEGNESLSGDRVTELKFVFY